MSGRTRRKLTATISGCTGRALIPLCGPASKFYLAPTVTEGQPEPMRKTIRPKTELLTAMYIQPLGKTKLEPLGVSVHSSGNRDARLHV